jgi:hypothetical protein
LKAAGLTIRKLTLLRDALQSNRNTATNAIDWKTSEWEANRPSGQVLGFVPTEISDLRAQRSRIDTALEEIRPALVSLTTIYSRGWLDMTPDVVCSTVRRGKQS